MASTRIVVVVVLCISVVASLNDVCTVCDCAKYESHYAIVCNCDKEKDLDFSDEFIRLRDEPNVSLSLSISGCQGVKFKKSLLLSATRVDVRRVTSLEIEEGAFGVLGELEIRRVTSLGIRSRAFFGRNVAALLVEDSHVHSVEHFALVNVRGMRRLELTRVTVNTIATDAVNYFGDQHSDVLIRDTEIMRIQHHGLALEGAVVTVVNSSFGSVEDVGVYLNLLSHLRLTNNTFKNLENSLSLQVYGGDVHVTGNTFNLFPSTYLVNFTEFSENEFQSPISSLPIEALTKMTKDHYNNSFQCECTDVFGKGLTLLDDKGFGDVLKNMFCISRGCPRSITHDHLLQEFQQNWTRCSLAGKCGTTLSEAHPFISTSSQDHPFIFTAILWLLVLVTAFW